METIEVVYEQDKQKMSKKISSMGVKVTLRDGYYLFSAYRTILCQSNEVNYQFAVKKKRPISWEFKCENTEN